MAFWNLPKGKTQENCRNSNRRLGHKISRNNTKTLVTSSRKSLRPVHNRIEWRCRPKGLVPKVSTNQAESSVNLPAV
eukprot:2999402-Amphidinium_carterae.1